MEKSHAYRDLKICSKDCLCLFVCPTGATDNETGQIDFSKCIGCGACAKACPSHAITMIPNKLPMQKVKDPKMIKALFKIVDSKIEQIKVLKFLQNKATNAKEESLLKALIHSNKVMIEDLLREAGFMLPQSKNAHLFLKSLQDEEINSKAATLLEKIEIND